MEALIDTLLNFDQSGSSNAAMGSRFTKSDFDLLGENAYSLIEELYPICRSITGDGLRETLNIIQRFLPLVIHEVPTGTQVFDWQVPNEWKIRDAYILDENNNRVVDFQESNLHVVNYSAPVNKVLSLSQLRERLHSLPEHPEWIPYRTSYYTEDWGFCVSHRQLQALKDGNYKVVIDSEIAPGAMSYGEVLLPGETDREILMFAHCCHPSLCNDNLSGVAILSILGQVLAGKKLRHSIRLVFAPATIGSITWLSQNESEIGKIEAGIVASVLGDSGKFRYKLSRSGNTVTDKACQHVLMHSGWEYEIRDFSPWGYDERQFCSPGINLPVGRLTRSPNGEYPEYHTSADDLSLVTAQNLAKSLELLLRVVGCIEADQVFVNTNPKCEPQLGRRGLYRSMGGFKDIEESKLAILWMLNLSDGKHSLLDIAIRSGLSYTFLYKAAQVLVQSGLLTTHSQES